MSIEITNAFTLKMRFAGPTNHKGSRYIITSDRLPGQRITMPYNCAYGPTGQDRHAAGAIELFLARLNKDNHGSGFRHVVVAIRATVGSLDADTYAINLETDVVPAGGEK